MTDQRKRRAHERPGRWHPGATRPGTRTVSVGLPAEAVLAVDRLAERDEVARNTWLQGIIMDELERRGEWPPRGRKDS